MKKKIGIAIIVIAAGAVVFAKSTATKHDICANKQVAKATTEKLAKQDATTKKKDCPDYPGCICSHK